MNAESDTAVRYIVRLLPERHELDVQLLLNGAVATGDIRIAVPNWVPGDYEFYTFGRDVFEVSAQNTIDGSVLKVTSDGWRGYTISGGQGSVTVRFRVYCYSNDLSESCGLLNENNGVILGTRYLYPIEHQGECEISFDVPPSWSVHCPSGPDPIREFSWQFASHEILVDTPIVFGHFDMFERRIDGTRFSFVFLDRGLGFDDHVDEFIDQVATAAAECKNVFGEFPFADYTYVMTLNPSVDWGLEHLSSTMVSLGPEVFIDRDQKEVGVRACTHELFHAWNVRRLRPATLGHIDFLNGNTTDGLWVAEGFTRYYEFLLCTRAGIYSPEQFFSVITNYFLHLSALPAYRRVSAVESSATAFLTHASYPAAVNDSIDYYAKGMLIAFGLDTTLRTGKRTDSLDRAFSTFYAEYAGKGDGYTTDQVLNYFGEIDPQLKQQLQEAATDVAGIELGRRLEMLGFSVKQEDQPYVGLVLQDDTGPSIYGVCDDAPAGSSGIAPEDVIVSVNGYPYTLQALQWVREHKQTLELRVLRGNEYREFEIAVEQRSVIADLTWHGSTAQARIISGWLKREFSPTKGQRFSLAFYENFHGIETVL